MKKTLVKLVATIVATAYIWYFLTGDPLAVATLILSGFVLYMTATAPERR